MEWKKNNTFGLTAFTSYGLFWLSLVGLVVMPQMGIAEPTEPAALAFYLFGWGVFTFVMFIGTLRLNRALQVIFLLLAVLFFLLAWGNAVHSPTIIRIAGIEGIICGHAAIYAGLAQVLNEVYGRTILPLGAKA